MSVLRRVLAGLLVAVGCLAGSAAVACFWLEHTVFDPSRSERVAAALLGAPPVRAALVDQTADALETRLPRGVRVPRAQLEAIAERAAADPRTAAAVAGAVGQVQARVRGDATGPVVLDSAALTPALADAARGVDPRLGLAVTALAARSPLAVELPVDSLPDLGRLHDLTERWFAPAAAAALGSWLLALLVAPRRSRVLISVGVWLLSASLVQVVLLAVLPRLLLPQLGAGWDAATAAVVDAWSAGLVGPLIALAVAGALLVVIGLVLRAAERRPRRHRERPVEPPRAPARRVTTPPAPDPGRAHRQSLPRADRTQVLPVVPASAHDEPVHWRPAPAPLDEPASYDAPTPGWSPVTASYDEPTASWAPATAASDEPTAAWRPEPGSSDESTAGWSRATASYDGATDGSAPQPTSYSGPPAGSASPASYDEPTAAWRPADDPTDGWRPAGVDEQTAATTTPWWARPTDPAPLADEGTTQVLPPVRDGSATRRPGG